MLDGLDMARERWRRRREVVVKEAILNGGAWGFVALLSTELVELGDTGDCDVYNHRLKLG